MTFNKANALLKKDIMDEDANDAFGIFTAYHYCDQCTHARVCEMSNEMDRDGETVAKCNFYEEEA